MIRQWYKNLLILISFSLDAIIKSLTGLTAILIWCLLTTPSQSLRFFQRTINIDFVTIVSTVCRCFSQARPPLTSKEAPVMYLDRVEAKNNEASAISRGSPKPPRGIWEIRLILTCRTKRISIDNYYLVVWAHLVWHFLRHWSLDKARQDHVDSDTKLAQLFSCSFGESYHPGLAGGIVWMSDKASLPYYAGNVDDGSRQLLLLHQTCRFLYQLRDFKTGPRDKLRNLLELPGKFPSS